MKKVHLLAGLAGVLAIGLTLVADDGFDAMCGHVARFEAMSSSVVAPPWFDEATGRDGRVYPPDRQVDYEHMRLELSIFDMNVPKLHGTQTLTATVLGRPLRELTLDAQLLDIESVEISGHETHVEHDGQVMTVAIKPAIPVGTRFDLVTQYSAEDPPDGLFWTTSSPEWPDRPPQIHTQGQPETNSYWFPCHDFPNERLTTEIDVTVPRGFIASSNGRLASRGARLIRPPGEYIVHRLQPYEYWHWTLEDPHPFYLVTLVVGKFDVVDVGDGSMPMPVYVPPGRGGDVHGTYGNSQRMVDLFERLLDEPYPWAQYAQLVVWNFGAGGMENTSATTMYDTAIFREEARADYDLDGLIAHELAHQWFGDQITCNSWEHIWLNEGFATYLTALWFEERDGQDGYQSSVLGSFDGVRARDRTDAPDQPALVSSAYDHPWEVFGKAANPYSKGASVLHMLRRRLGDEVFFSGLADYLDRHRFDTVETSDFRKSMEASSGENLEQFFWQWCERPGIPDLAVSVQWDSSSGELVFDASQTQHVDGENPAFEFDLPVWIMIDGEPREIVESSISVRSVESVARLPLPAEPAIVALNAHLDVLCRLDVQQDENRWVAQLRAGPTLAARVQAARALAEVDGGVNADRLLVGIALQSTTHRALREEAVRSLAARGSHAELLQLVRSDIQDSNVLVAIVESMPGAAEGDFRPLVEQTLANVAMNHRSGRVRGAAVRALGDMDARDRVPLVLRVVETSSQHDRIRQDALRALTSLDAPEGLDPAIRSAQFGNLNRTRPVAIQTIVALSHHDPDRAYEAIAALLADSERRTWRSAGQALVNLEDARGIGDLQAHRESLRDPAMQAEVSRWIAGLEERLGVPTSMR